MKMTPMPEFKGTYGGNTLGGTYQGFYYDER